MDTHGGTAAERDYAVIIVSDLRQAGAPEDLLTEYAACAAGMTVTSVGASGNVRLDVDDRADDGSARAIISALDRLLTDLKSAEQVAPLLTGASQ